MVFHTLVLITELYTGVNGLLLDLQVNTQVCGNDVQVFMCVTLDFVLNH